MNLIELFTPRGALRDDQRRLLGSPSCRDVFAAAH